MPATAKQARLWIGATIAAIAALTFLRLSSFGIWDPWEIGAADLAREILDGETQAPGRRAPLAAWLVAKSFALFGISEGAGRFPLALGGAVTALAAFLLGKRHGDLRTGAYAALIAGTTPFFLFNSRQMFGDSLAFGASGLVGVLAFELAFSAVEEDADKLRKRVALQSLGLVATVALAVLAGGGLGAALPPLAGTAVAVLLTGRLKKENLGAIVVSGIAVLMGLQVVQAVIADAAIYSPWTGGAPRGGEPPTFEAAIEVVFHGFAPWSALVLLAMARILRPNEAGEDLSGRGPRLALLLWAAFGYGALTLYTARYGVTTYLALVPLAVPVAMLLRDIEESDRSWWPEAIVGVLLTALVIRDYALFPESALRGLPVEGVEFPEAPGLLKSIRTGWAAVLGAFAASLVVGFGATPGAAKPNLLGLKGWLKDQWNLGWAHRGWLVLAAALGAGSLVFGLLCFAVPDSLGLTSIALRVGKGLFFLTPAVAALVVAIPWLFYFAGKASKWRTAPVLVSALAVGVYASHVFAPTLSAHFSPRAVYDTYNELRSDGEQLAEYRVSGRAAAYYAEGDIVDAATQAELLEFLGSDERRWAVVPADELPNLNRGFRRAAERHLFVADASSARMLLITNQPFEGRENENFVAEAILDEEPNVQHRSGGRFDDRIELIGYDLVAPQEGYVGAGQSITIRWYWRCLNRVPGGHKIFLHIDGAGSRLNGDHEPVGDRYPVRLWDEGDIIVDEQELRVPANYRPGRYTMWIGFYAGSNRLDVTEGPEDDANRLNAGSFVVR